MYRSLLGFASIMLLLSASLVMPTDAHARRCDEEQPKSLLTLYRASTAIHIAKFDRTEDLAIKEDDENYAIIEVRHRFTVSSTLKGEPAKLVSVSDTEYRRKENGKIETTENTMDSEIEYSELHLESMAYGIGKIERGDQVMLFVRSGEAPNEIVLADYRGAVKKLSSQRMASYEKAINDLNGIFATEPASDQEIVDWMVRMVRDPLTRWEGTVDLLSAVQTKESRQEFQDNIKDKLARGVKLEEWEQFDKDSPDHNDAYYGPGVIKYADLLNDSQKQEMLDVLIDVISKSAKAETAEGKPAKAESMPEGDLALLELASRWGDSRLVTLMLDRLRNGGDEPYETSQLMEKVASILKDDQMKTLASRHTGIFYAEADETIDSYTVEANIEDLADRTVDEKGNAVSPQITYGQLRSELLGKFMDRAALVLNDPNRPEPRQ